MPIKIGKKKIGKEYPVFIIAEVGVNHNGNIKIAKSLVDAAVLFGADAVKFQSFSTDALIRKDAPKAKYQDRNIGKKKSQYQMLKELELGIKEMREIAAYCKSKNIIFFSTPYDIESIEILVTLNVSVFKLASIDIVCHPLISKIAKTGKPLILSTGMATEDEIKDAVEIFRKTAGNTKNLILLQCNTNYPSRLEDQNLLSLNILRKYVKVIGYSDHTIGNEASVAAVVLGAKVIERHLTLDRNMVGPDHKTSLDPHQFKQFVSAVRNTEILLGKTEKRPSGGELENIIGMRRSICAKKSLAKGQKISLDDLAYKRPGNGLLPIEKNINWLIGKRARRDIDKDENLVKNLVY